MRKTTNQYLTFQHDLNLSARNDSQFKPVNCENISHFVSSGQVSSELMVNILL